MAGGVVTETVSRDGLYEAQTPQVFAADVIRAAYQSLKTSQRPTDDAQVVEQAGHPVAIVETDRRNLKITTPFDLTLAGAVLRTISKEKKSSGPRSPFDEAQW